MPATAPAFVTVHPSFIEPGLILQYAQASGFINMFAGERPMVRLGEGDLWVYMKRLDMRVNIAVGQASYNQLPSPMMTPSQISAPTYLQRVRAEWDHHDINSYSHWGIPLPEAQRLATRQGHFQFTRNAAFYGVNAANGEGIVNANGATSVNLPADTFGDTTIVTYDNGQLAFFLLQQIVNIKTRTNQLGIPHRFNIIGPQRDLGQMEYPNIVQLTSYQRLGAGAATTAQVVKEVAAANGDVITWTYDDTLIGKGAGSNDLIIINMPEVVKPIGQAPWNTNVFAGLEPGLDACAVIYCDMAAPREIISPLAGGATDMLTEMRTTPGWAVRPETVTLLSAQYQ